jgi:hypothetical protein
MPQIHTSAWFLFYCSEELYVLAKEESIKGMLNLQRGFDAKDITGFFRCHRSVCLLVSFLMQRRAICSRERRVYQRNVQSAERI